MNLYYHRKLYALLYQLGLFPEGHGCEAVDCLQPYAQELQVWWDNQGTIIQNVGKASDRVTLDQLAITPPVSQVSHLISGQWQDVGGEPGLPPDLIVRLNQVAGSDARKGFWWLWRFYPEFLLAQQTDALLFPADLLIPDCPQHSYYSTVSALAGAIPPDWQATDPDKHPYLLLFTFSPVQEFIKSSRKFLDFWAGSYLLHYLSARLCWFIARVYGPDAVITPSLWSQEIIDALLVKQYAEFRTTLAGFQDGSDPVTRFKDKTSTSLSTAGFPNVITAIVPGKQAAEQLGNHLSKHLKTLWRRMAYRVRDEIRSSTINYLNNLAHQEDLDNLCRKLADAEGLVYDDPEKNPNQQELERWRRQSLWEWKHLWNAQIYHSWEPYWTVVPLGNPENLLEIYSPSPTHFDGDWIDNQETVAPSRPDQPTPMPVENELYESLNIGTWWGNVQSRLAQGIQAFKNTRVWQVSPAPGERSTLSGQLSALHPSFRYQIHQSPQGHISDFREGAGIASGSMQLFWELMSLVYPGLFNGSEKLNALELTKRMAWVYGGVAQSLGIDLMNQQSSHQNFDYESFIRFPNLSSIAAARFAEANPQRIQGYWNSLKRLIQADTLTFTDDDFDKFAAKTRRPFQIQNADLRLQTLPMPGNGYNGVMFSSKWLADDMGLKEPRTGSSAKLTALRQAVSQAHRDCNFGDSSPGDWWAIVAADGDNMGKYVSGRKLELYEQYLDMGAIGTHPAGFDKLLQTRKRMGPATHIGLNRALLDFSNRIVPYLTEKRFCGKVVYSGGDDVLAVFPLADVLQFLRSLRAAWSGAEDPGGEFESRGGYWHPRQPLPGLPHRPLFTMGQTATLSAGIVIAHKSVPLPTVLESLWSAEEDRAKKMEGTSTIPVKDGLCFRVIYGSGNVLEACMKGQFLEQPWWDFICSGTATDELSPVLYRLAEELPIHSCLTPHSQLISKAARVIVNSRDQQLPDGQLQALENWLNAWEEWAYAVQSNWEIRIQSKPDTAKPVGCTVQDLASLLRFSAFLLDKTAS
ncbi:type III-B CRISPR-associated protein Cas10/Cmr2 [Laspinema olomoucense]|uniref:type III-B CRISPR-associated protein Cas10/Cmr2 n=1 Tax=Laspinema olomoucense TaxID=3231600 RepID=UPI0021BA6F49|nr:type III-B CRISPR-associated protein Cas10/Cmr2 [Laspinema sp. D3d]MCT7973453.1 type III-B CRISPR-associated protein Cas10/Cmr2 [Laspinema sp. D3d]